MEKQHPIETSLWKILSTIAAVGVIVATATWTIAQLLISNELESYRAAKDWDVKAAIFSISELSKKAAIDASERNEFILLKEQKKELSERIEIINSETSKQLNEQKIQYEEKLHNLSAEIEKLRDSNIKLSTAYKNIVSDSFSIDIPKGEAKYAIPNMLSIGVENTYGTFASVIIEGNNNISMSPGGKTTIEKAGFIYTITLMKITDKGCTFAVNTNKNN